MCSSSGAGKERYSGWLTAVFRTDELKKDAEEGKREGSLLEVVTNPSVLPVI